MQARISWLAWSCGGKLRVPLELHIDLGDPLHLLREVRSPLVLQGAPQDSSLRAIGLNRASSRVEVGTLVFLSISDIGLGVPAELKQGSQASSSVEARNSTCLSSCSWGVRPLVDLYLEPATFSGGCNWGFSARHFLLHPRDYIHRGARASGLTLSGRGNRCLLECGMTHEASSRVSMWDWPPPEVRSDSCLILYNTWTAAHRAPLSFIISWSLLKFMSSELVMLSNYLILCHPLLLLPSLFPSIMVFSSESALRVRWPNYWIFSISPSNEYSGLISFSIDWFDLLAV